jgi:hypothetical protein
MTLTCKNHPDLRWRLKDVGWTKREDGTGYYNGSRNLFYLGRYSPNKGDYANYDYSKFTDDEKFIPECDCRAVDLIVAPESVPDGTA